MEMTNNIATLFTVYNMDQYPDGSVAEAREGLIGFLTPGDYLEEDMEEIIEAFEKLLNVQDKLAIYYTKTINTVNQPEKLVYTGRELLDRFGRYNY